jgi:hypothetical protein
MRPKLLALGISTSLLVAGCAASYKPPPDAETSKIEISGTLDDRVDPKQPIYAFVASIDGQRVGTEKSARCNFDRRYALVPGVRSIIIGYSVGRDWTESLVGRTEISLDSKPGIHYVAKGAFRPPSTGLISVESNGKLLVQREIPLVPHPQKNIPVGFAAMVNSCALP